MARLLMKPMMNKAFKASTDKMEAYLIANPAPATPIVQKGDEVKVGQIIAKSSGFVSTNIHSSVSGKVKKVKKVEKKEEKVKKRENRKNKFSEHLQT